MDYNQIKGILENGGCTDNKKSTCLRQFSRANYENFDTDQLTNRANSAWKTAQYIIVQDIDEQKRVELLRMWRKLAEDFGNQYLLLKTYTDSKYKIYDCKGSYIGDDSILAQLIEKNRIADAQLDHASPDITHGAGENIILYGVPGCGKSFTIKNEYCDDENYMERIVFHPDYTYSDFVGQVLPHSDGEHISYPFAPGPFTRILRKAVKNPDKEYFLIIEELNRGNAPAIFGEIFQLLDRKNGESEYGINNSDIAKTVYGDETHPVKIPGNLFILATMNTADQNVFTLDTAFKRRWRMKSIPNDITKCKYANHPVCNSNVTWASFLATINNVIISLADSSVSSEDKRLGAFFVQENELSDYDLFGDKVLMYLWNDVVKYDPSQLFRPEYKTLEQLLDGFKDNTFSVFLETIPFEISE